MRGAARLVPLALALSVGPVRVRAQDTRADEAAALKAYQNLDFDVAAASLRRLLGASGAAQLTGAERARALCYLGAADFFRGRRDSARAVFQRVVERDPRYRPDPLIFPPDITTLYETVRRESKALVLELPADQQVRSDSAPLRLRLVTSSPQRVDVGLWRPDGSLFRSLYSGPLGDSLDLQWDGLDAAGHPPNVSRLWVRASRRGASQAPDRPVQASLDVRVIPVDTEPWPAPVPDSLLLPEHVAQTFRGRTLVMGAALAVAAVALPTVISGQSGASGGRFLVGAAIGASSVVGFVRGRAGRPIPANVQANDARRAAWERSLAAVKAENATRQGVTVLTVHAGPTAVTTSEDR